MTIPTLPTAPNSVTRQPTFAADIDLFFPALNPWAVALDALAAAMTAVAAGGAVSLQYTFDTTTTDADPGAGKLRLNQATQNTATVIRADLLGSDTSDYSGVLALLDDSTSTLKGYITLRHATNATKWLVFSVASLASPSGYKNVTVTVVASSVASPFANGDAILFDFTPTGDMGSTGPAGDSSAGKNCVPIPAGAMYARTTNGAASGSVEMATNKNMFKTFDFDAATAEFVQFCIPMLDSWNEGTITFEPVWSHAATTTNFGVVYTLAAVAVSDNEAGDAAFGTAQSSTDTGGTTNKFYEGPESAAITVAGTPAVGDTVMFQLSRLVSDGGDTMAIDARLHGIKLYITTDAAHD